MWTLGKMVCSIYILGIKTRKIAQCTHYATPFCGMWMSHIILPNVNMNRRKEDKGTLILTDRNKLYFFFFFSIWRLIWLFSKREVRTRAASRLINFRPGRELFLLDLSNGVNPIIYIYFVVYEEWRKTRGLYYMGPVTPP